MDISFDLSHDLDLEFSRSVLNLLHHRNNGLIAMKQNNEHINLTLGFKYGHHSDLNVTLAMTMTLKFCYISEKKFLIATRRKKLSDCHKMKNEHT